LPAARTQLLALSRDGLLLLQHLRGFDQGGRHAADEVHIDVAVEEPHARVVGPETEDEIALGGNDYC
jgi:hypothetical protein